MAGEIMEDKIRDKMMDNYLTKHDSRPRLVEHHKSAAGTYPGHLKPEQRRGY